MPGMPVPGAEWAGFHIEEQIGSEGFGRVYVAWDRELDRRVALKAIPPDAGAGASERFLRESELAARLDHPRMVPIHRVGEHDGVPYLVMRYVAGGDLRYEIGVSPLTLDRTTSVIGQTASALDHAHRHGLVHGGVKPANILCADGADDVYLTDFGVTRDLAVASDMAGTEAASATGPVAFPYYAAPEQVRGEASTAATDIYGLGCTLFECLTGRVPFPGRTPRMVADDHVHTPPPRVSRLRPDLPVSIDAIVGKAMAKDPGERYPSARALAEAVALVEVVEPETTHQLLVGFSDPVATRPIVSPDDADDADASTPPEPGRSVFAAGAAAPSAPEEPVSEPPADATTPMPTVGGRRLVADDGAIDGAAFGVYDDDERRSRVPWIVGGLLFLAVVAVTALVWRAINTDAELATDTPASTTTQPVVDESAPSIEALRAYVPAGIDTCVDPSEGADTTRPEDEPAPVVLQCPLEGAPETLVLEMFATVEERDDAFDAAADSVGVVDDREAECALGRTGRHPFEAEDHRGTVGCHATAGRVDFLWTRDDAAVLLHATGGGGYAEYATAWDELARRTDAEFPLPEEQLLLDAIPDELRVDCRRDLGLILAAAGSVATQCEPAAAEPTVVSWVRFDDGAAMDTWIAQRRAALDRNVFASGDDGCTPTGFGQSVDPPAPDAAYEPYDFDGSSGQVLCFVDTAGQNVIFWTRDGSNIGSIAVSDRTAGATMVDLLTWWRDRGHRP